MALERTFAQASLVPTATEERVRAAQALSGELSRSLERLEGVLDARVHLSLPDAREAPLDGSAARELAYFFAGLELI